MKVLKNNYVKTDTSTEEKFKKIELYPRAIICENCSSNLEYEESDLKMGAYGCVFVCCPLCHYDNMIEDNENSITLTANNIEFPIHFFHTSKENGAVDNCNNENIKKEVRRGIDFLRNNKEEFSWMAEYGNLYIEIKRFDGDENYEIIVSNDFYTTYIPFDFEDY